MNDEIIPGATGTDEQPVMPWERRADEPNVWFDRFETYRLQGAGRSIYGAYTDWRERSGANSAQRRGGVPRSWREAAKRYNWAERAEAFDAYQRQIDATEWEQRRAEFRQAEWKLAQDLLEKSRQMLVFPLAKTMRSDSGGTVVTEILPARWTFSDAGRMAESASRLAHAALGDTVPAKEGATGVSVTVTSVSADDLSRITAEMRQFEVSVFGTSDGSAMRAPATETDALDASDDAYSASDN